MFSNRGKRDYLFRNESTYDYDTLGVPCLVIGARGVTYFVMNQRRIMTHKGFHV